MRWLHLPLSLYLTGKISMAGGPAVGFRSKRENTNSAQNQLIQCTLRALKELLKLVENES